MKSLLTHAVAARAAAHAADRAADRVAADEACPVCIACHPRPSCAASPSISSSSTASAPVVFLCVYVDRLKWLMKK